MGKYNRRHLLKALGIATLTGTAGRAFSAPGNPPVSAGKENLYPTVADLQNDRSLKAGMFVRTMGYHKVGDQGGAAYSIERQSALAGGGIQLGNGLHAALINVSVVNYRMFGAVCDGIHDDGLAIKMAHDYANRLNLPVINQEGSFWIKGTHSVVIQGNVDWGQTVFYIDEKFESNEGSLFIVQSRELPRAVAFDAATRARVLEQVKPGVTIIPEFAPYKNCFVVITDTDDRIGFRSGPEYGGKVSKPKQEFFFVEEHGRILGDIAWQFSGYTSLVAYPGNSSYLVINGGTFYMSGENPSVAKGYVNVGFSVRRSRTIIRNQWVGLGDGRADDSLVPKNGFYSFSSVYDVLLENVRLIPWEKDRPGKDRDVPQGTYGIGGSLVLNATFRNITAEGSPVHWGVFGTNLFKNFRVDQCVLNRVDVHFHCWNLYIKDSKIGTNGITITGGGDLFVENTTCIGGSFIAFRRDFGARWDGDIRIRNCRHAPTVKGETAILSFLADNFDYRYPIGYGKTVRVEDMVVDFSTVPGSTSASWLMRTSPFSLRTDGGRVFFPHHLEFRNITVEGREAGMRLLQLWHPQHYAVARKGAYDGVQLKSNCNIIFENVQLEQLPPDDPRSELVHLAIRNDSKTAYKDGYALFPTIRLTGCDGVAAHFGGAATTAFFERCRVTRLTGGVEAPMPGSLAFSNCNFEAVVKSGEHDYYSLAAVLGTSFTNCIIYAPVVDGRPAPKLVDKLGFLQLNRKLMYNHLNTRLGNDILHYLKESGQSLSQRFIAMLKSHHELEG